MIRNPFYFRPAEEISEQVLYVYAGVALTIFMSIVVIVGRIWP